jgi:hypothetical protein
VIENHASCFAIFDRRRADEIPIAKFIAGEDFVIAADSTDLYEKKT